MKKWKNACRPQAGNGGIMGKGDIAPVNQLLLYNVVSKILQSSNIPFFQ
jgi:hypothetical protein